MPAVRSKRVARPRQVFVSAEGQELYVKGVKKFYRDIVVYQNGYVEEDNKLYTVYDAVNTLNGGLIPSENSPICQKCGLFNNSPKHPFLEFQGSPAPIVTLVLDAVSSREDEAGILGCDGTAGLLKKIIAESYPQHGVSVDEIRFVPTTRCANREKVNVNYKAKGRWCRYHVIEDLFKHPPRLIMPVGSCALGLLSYKSNAQDWGGRLLTYRGWPDDWLTEQAYAMPVPDPADLDWKEKGTGRTKIGHPLFGPIPDTRLPMVPIQAPRLIYALRNPQVLARWKKQIVDALKMAKEGVTAKTYTRPWYRVTEDPDEIEATLRGLLFHPGILLCYDTETTGLRPLAPDAAIVFIMFRWDDPSTGEPRTIGFPWNFATSAVQPHIERLSPLLLKVLKRSTLLGHNLTFDILYTYFNIHDPRLKQYKGHSLIRARDNHLVALANAAKFDTWHMRYCLKQQRGSLGLEILVYDYCPDLAGYEEDMTLLIELNREAMHPDERKGGHYANCPKDKWDSHLIPYVMGDVEGCYGAFKKISEKLDSTKLYKIPLAKPGAPGIFRLFQPPGRGWLYEHIMSPAARMLMKVMGRGMHVDIEELERLESAFPAKIKAARETLRTVDERIVNWCEEKKFSDPDWEFDVEEKTTLKHIIFDILNLPVQRLTKNGRKIYGEDPTRWTGMISDALRLQGVAGKSAAIREEMMKYAALDKFTLNKLSVDHEQIRPLQEYRKLFKLWNTYVRPIRNKFDPAIDSKKRIKEQHLCSDDCIHAQFMQTSTRSGRLASRDPNLQQLPRKSDVKGMFTSRFGTRGCLYGSDLSQIELRLLAAACGDPTMVQAYFDGTDLHSLTASRIFKIPYEHFTKEHFTWLQQHKRGNEAKELEQKRTISKCVDPETLISVNGKIMRIADLHPGREPDTFYELCEDRFVQTPSGQAKINLFYSNGISERLLVVSRHGILACSKIHRLKLKDGRMVMAKDLTENDVLNECAELKSENNSKIEIQFSPVSSTEIKSGNFNIVVDEKLAYLLGLFYGDGHSSKESVRIVTGGKPQDAPWQNIIAKHVTDIGFTARAVDTTFYDPIKNHASGEVFFGSRRVSDILVQLGAVEDTPRRSRSLRIPTWLFNASYELRRAFIAGFIDIDGSTNRGHAISVVSKSWVLIQDVSVMLRSMGITHAIEPCWNKTYYKYYYRINVTVRDSWKHFKGHLKCKHKDDRLRAPKFKYSQETPNRVLKVIPLEPAYLVDINVNVVDHVYCANGLACKNTSNFLTGYGGGAFGLQNVLANNQIYLPLAECEYIISSFFSSYPTLKQHLQYYKRFILDNAVAVSLFGRVRVFEEVYGDDDEFTSKALRAGYNHLIQSTASDMMLIALILVENIMRAESMESMLVSTVHDSLLIDAVRDELPKVHEICDSVLNNFHEVLPLFFGDDYDMSWALVPFAGDAEVGLNYADMNHVDKNPDWNKLLAS